MEKTVVVSEPQVEQSHYVTAGQFLQRMREMHYFPYGSVFSLEPFLAKLDTKESLGADHPLTQYRAAAVKHFDAAMLEKANGQLGQQVEHFVSVFLPGLNTGTKRAFLSGPFDKNFVFQTPMLEEIFSSDLWQLKIDPCVEWNAFNKVLQAGCAILEKHYGVHLPLDHEKAFTLHNRTTGREHHFKMQLDLNYVEIDLLQPLKKLSQQEINELLNRLGDHELWLQQLPPENFAFRGFVIGEMIDITRIQILSRLKDQVVLLDDDIKPQEFFPLLQKLMQDFLGRDDIEVGIQMIQFAELFDGDPYSLNGSQDLSDVLGKKRPDDSPSIYEDVSDAKETLVINDLQAIAQPTRAEQRLIDKGIRSLILYPLFNAEGGISSILEIGSPSPCSFNQATLMQLNGVFELMRSGNEKFLKNNDSRVNLFIQEQFTSIHPSVEWKFVQAATKYQINANAPGFDGSIDPIVFKDVYPIYGQADIVGSSTRRNQAIQRDLTDNLKAVIEVMESWTASRDLYLVESYLFKARDLLASVESSYVASDESEIVDFIVREINPLLQQLRHRHQDLPGEIYAQYLDLLNSELGIVYNHRKEYEASVARINLEVGNYVEEADQKIQEVLPHFFEKYKTDGIEYNLYLGQSILENGTFTPADLKEFRLWQLILMCETTRKSNRLAERLPVALKTAQLIFVYNNPISIRFRMDEKQFDVDGTYNVRYEILKKRIDKAVIKGTNERLTEAGKVAIVFLQDRDRGEYLEHFEYLRKKGLIEAEHEDLELAPLQGAEGLKALRITVK